MSRSSAEDADRGRSRPAPASSETPLNASLHVLPVVGLPEITEGADLGALIAQALEAGGAPARDGDVVVVSSKIISKAMGLRVPTDQRVVAVLQESTKVVAERASNAAITRIVESMAGPVMAAAGVDASNAGDPGPEAAEGGTVLVLPRNPDAAATRLLTQLRTALAQRHGRAPALALIVSDTAGRPWRKGQVDFALGAANLRVAVDHRGGVDDDGRPIQVTVRAVADEIAAAADLVKGKTRRVPVVLVRGLAELVVPGDGMNRADESAVDGARWLVRTGAGDWFGYGHTEAVRRVLGIEPGTAAAIDVGLAPTDPAADSRESRIARACAVALHPDGLGDLPPAHPRAHLVLYRADLASVQAQLIQYGLRVEATEPFTLGLAVGRLLAALAGEDVPARLAQRDDSPSPSGRARASALLIFA